jgi:hypothetical protein
MKIKIDFVTNSSSTVFTLESVVMINLLNTHFEDQHSEGRLIYKDGEEEYEEYENETFRDFGYTMTNIGEDLLIEIDGYFSPDYTLKRNDVISTGRHLKCIERCLNKLDKKIKLPDEFQIHFKQTPNFMGDGWDDGDYRFSGQGYVFHGDTKLATQKLSIDTNFECCRNLKGKIIIDIPKFLMKLGN